MRYYFYFALLSLVIGNACQLSSSNRGTDGSAAKDWAFPNFEKVDSLNPILEPDPNSEFTDPVTGSPVNWESRNVLNPTALVRNDSVFLLYRAQDATGTSRIGMAVSKDGLHFEKRPTPVFFPEQDSFNSYEWNYKKRLSPEARLDTCKTCLFDGVEDPRIVQMPSGKYLMTYTAYDGKTARLSLASSHDLVHWQKHGVVLDPEKYPNQWSKAGAIVCELKNGQFIAKKIKGKYWMYFGDTDLFMATSDDLLNWEVAESAESGSMLRVLHPRSGYFDSRLVEPGPFALWRASGIVLIYNSSNAANYNDPDLPIFTYAAGQALFDPQNPYRLLDRTTDYFIYPDKDYEKVGEVNEVCFVEGLVYFKGNWFLYYGTADSKIAVAICEG